MLTAVWDSSFSYMFLWIRHVLWIGMLSDPSSQQRSEIGRAGAAGPVGRRGTRAIEHNIVWRLRPCPWDHTEQSASPNAAIPRPGERGHEHLVPT